MSKYVIRYFLGLIILAACSCAEETILKDIEQIKSVGDNNPQKALTMLDSLEIDIRESSKYAKAKYDLLRIRLNDKAEKTPTSDIQIMKLYDYFEREGTVADIQEATYYAGSIYRDLHDTPRALKYFLKSLDYPTDSLILRNTYSNLNYLYYQVQNFQEAARMAQKELEVSRRNGMDCINAYMHLGTALLSIDSISSSKKAFDAAYAEIIHSGKIPRYQHIFVYLLCHYSELGEIAKAKECLPYIDLSSPNALPSFTSLALALYYEASEQTDSTIIYCKRILDEGTDLNDRYDAAKILFRIYSKRNDTTNAYNFAKHYMLLSDSLDFGKRQELAAIVRNEFQYHLDEKKEQILQEENERYRGFAIIASLTAIVLICLGLILHMWRKYRHMQEIIMLSSVLQQLSNADEHLHAEIAQKEQELSSAKESLESSANELHRVKQELERVKNELVEHEKILKDREQQLSIRTIQNKTFIQLLHQSEFEDKAEDVIIAIRQSSVGKRNLKPTEWKRLYQSVDELYPLFRERLLRELKTFNEQQIQVCYLMRIGLSSTQIQNLTDLSRATVWRWMKKFEWVMSPDTAG